MTFFNATLILGTLAAIVPIALHFLARREPKRVVFPGVQFLRPKLTSQRSRLRIRRWWLLALRILAVIALAIALARPHVDAAMSSTWWSIGLMITAGAGLLILASIAVARGMGRSLAIGMAVAGLVTLVGSLAYAAQTWATSDTTLSESSAPVAMAILIDNGPSSKRQQRSSANESIDRLTAAIREASTLMDRLPDGSRLAVLDRSSTPVGFSLDVASARSRLAQLSPLPNPVAIDERMDAAKELLRSSDLPGKQLVVISDWNAGTWSTSSSQTADAPDEIAISLLKLATPVSETKSTSRVNHFLTLPRLADASPAAGVPLPISVIVGSDGSGGDGSGGDDAGPINLTVQLSLYERDPSLPVIRDGTLVLPPLRSVDRSSVSLTPNPSGVTQSEVVLTLPPLDLGTHHAVLELVGSDSFAWDDRRYLSIHLPEPSRVVLVGDDLDERNLMAAALTAPHPPDDDRAGIRLAAIGYADLPAVDWNTVDAVAMIDPPIRIDATTQRLISNGSVNDRLIGQLTGLTRRGGGVVMLLGPAMEIDGVAGADGNSAEDRFLPTLVRSWRVPDPGTFLDVRVPSHPSLRLLSLSEEQPPWNAFRIQRYWQTKTDQPSDWLTLARYAGTNHAALLTRTVMNATDSETGIASRGNGHVAVLTTPLPALGKNTRSWNELFSGADAWPAFATWRGTMQWATGATDQAMTVLVGSTAIVPTTQPGGIDASDRQLTEGVLRYGPSVEDTASSEPTDALTSDGVMTETNELGTTFLRGPNYWGGFSTNLDLIWSSDDRVGESEMDERFGDDQWQSDSTAQSLVIRGGDGSAPVSLHGPMMLLAVIVFLAEQLLGNRFYRSSGATT